MSRPLTEFKSDRDNDVKDLYEKIYPNISISGIRRIMTIVLGDSKKTFVVNGDQCINLKLGNAYDGIGSIINLNKLSEDSVKKIEELNLLIDYYSHTILNYSILPVTGGLNNIKWRLGSDRIDTFIFVLDQYYKNINRAIILNSGSSNGDVGTRKKLESFLSSFGSVEEFVSFIYRLDPDDSKKFIKDSLGSGSEPILDIKGLCQYMELAVDFWELRLESMQKSGVLRLKSGKEKVEKDFELLRDSIEKFPISKN